MIVVITRNASGRMRGYLASCMCEISPTIYVSTRMNAGVRDRVWATMESWFIPSSDMSVVMVMRDQNAATGIGIRVLGEPTTDLAILDGHVLARRELRKGQTGFDEDVPF